ncbi:MAG: F0F1 ATP synthase subunit A [Rhodoferax sp.]
MAAENAGEHAMTSGGYIVHHLTQLQNAMPKGLVDFSVFSYDSTFFATLLGVIACGVFWVAARRMTSGVPGRFQAAVEIMVEMVDRETKSIVHNKESRKFAAPLALTLFVWILLLNLMDLVPVDLLPLIWEKTWLAFGGSPHYAYLRVVPTADLSIPLGSSVMVLLITLYYSIKIKGLGGWMHELFTAPFGNHWLLYPFNFIMQMIEFISKTFSHGMRLFGNMYAGELLFLLIALLGGAVTFSLTGAALAVGHIIAGTLWSIFDILVIVLQAYIFMMLTLVYIGQAHDSH